MSEGAVKKEEKPRKFQAIRGTRDLLPPETALWNRVEQMAHEVFGTFGYGEIRPPIFESTELFARGVGGDTDIVSKEMYTFQEGQFEESQSGPWGNLQESIDFVNAQNSPLTMRKFLEELVADFESGEIEKTEENRNAISTIRSVSEELFAIPEPSEEGPEDEVLERLYTYFDKRKPFVNRLSDVWFQLNKKHPISLRPEATASVCRAYIENNMNQLPQPVKLYYMGPMFRRERPQKGRYRQFYQIGAEVLGGSDAPGIDAEVIEMVMTFFEKLELQGVQLDINSIGCRECRPKYVEKLREELLKVKDKLGADSQRRIETNPLRVLDSKLEHEQAIIEKLPRIADHLCEECKTHYAAVKHELELRNVKYHQNWRLVRGLDYYMRTTFEITAKGLGSQNAVCGGGRYDGLVELLGGPPTKGIGFAIGEDRLILSLQESGKGKGPRAIEASTVQATFTADAYLVRALDVYIAWMGENARATALRAAKNLRNAGFRVELPPVEQKFGKALGQADKLGAKFALILGDNEVSSGEWTLKTLATGEQAKMTEPQLLEFLRK